MHWYVLSTVTGMVALCASEIHARREAQVYDRLYPDAAPHIATRLVPVEDADEIERLQKIEAALIGRDEWVLVRLRRSEGYEDVHPEILTDDAIGYRWPEYETLTPNAAVTRRAPGDSD